MIENEFNLPSIPEILEEKEYKHRTKYRSLYIRLIKRGLSMTEKELNGYNEKHHILPRCMNGNDNKENLVLLPVRYHIMAHIILLEAYPDHTGICYAAFCMINGFKPKRDLSIQKHFSTRLIAKTREKAKSNLHLSEEQKALISKRNKGKKLTPEQLKTWSEVKKEIEIIGLVKIYLKKNKTKRIDLTNQFSKTSTTIPMKKKIISEGVHFK